ncbi:MAG TPA: rhodanese-like domain-containing protein [Candidatus Binatia bacterium]
MAIFTAKSLARHRRAPSFILPRAAGEERGGGTRVFAGCATRTSIYFYPAALTLLIAMLAYSSNPLYAGHGEEPVQTISMERVKFLLDNKEKIFFVDLRTPKEFQQKRLPGARSIPVAELEKRLTEIPKTGRVILYCTCRPGDDSYAYFLLRDNDYANISVIDDGFDEWVKRKFPVESGKR